MKTEKLFRWVPIKKGMTFNPTADTIVKFDNGSYCSFGNDDWPFSVATHYSEPIEAVVMEPEEVKKLNYLLSEMAILIQNKKHLYTETKVGHQEAVMLQKDLEEFKSLL